MTFKLWILLKCIFNLGFTNVHLCAYIVHSMRTVSRPFLSHTPFVCYLEYDLLKSANYYETLRYAVFESSFV
jgi:hypothetical protein